MSLGVTFHTHLSIDFLVNLLFIRGNEIANIKQTQRLSFQSILAFVV